MPNSPDRHKRELVNICECWKSRMTMGRAAMTRAVMTRALRLEVLVVLVGVSFLVEVDN